MSCSGSCSCSCIFLSIYLFVCLSICLSVCLSASLKTKLFCDSPQFLNLTTSKTQQFCETSLIFELDNVKNEAILRDVLIFDGDNIKTKQFCEMSFKNGKLSAELTASYQCVLRFFHSSCPKYRACHEKVMPGHTKCCTCHGKIISANLKIWGSKMESLSGNQRPDILTALMNMSLVLRLPRKMQRFCTLTSKCALRHNGVHLFDISTSKSGPNMVCFGHFDFQICFAPQRRALFWQLNFQKCSEREMFLAFSLANVLRATTACNFSFLMWPDGSAPAALASLLFDPPEPKNTVFRDFPTFSRTWVFFLLTLSLCDLLSSSLPFSSLTLPISAFHLSKLSEVWLLNFLRSFVQNPHLLLSYTILPPLYSHK